MIPLHFHLIWEGKKFPFVNRLAIESLLQTQPGARITLHFGNPPDNEHWRALQGRIEFKEINLDELLDGLPMADGIRQTLSGLASNYPAGRSNILRYLALHKWGGIYLDFDTITLRSFEDLLQLRGFIGQERVFKCDDDRVKGQLGINIAWAAPAFGISYGISRLNHRHLHWPLLDSIDRAAQWVWSDDKLNNAVLACEAGSPFFRRVLELVPETDPSIRYNLGPILMNRVWDETGGLEMTRMDNDFFYAIAPSQTDRFFCAQQQIPEQSYVVHWCSSNEKDKAALLEQSYLSQSLRPDSILFHQLSKPVIDRMPQ